MKNFYAYLRGVKPLCRPAGQPASLLFYRHSEPFPLLWLLYTEYIRGQKFTRKVINNNKWLTRIKTIFIHILMDQICQIFRIYSNRAHCFPFLWYSLNSIPLDYIINKQDVLFYFLIGHTARTDHCCLIGGCNSAKGNLETLSGKKNGKIWTLVTKKWAFAFQEFHLISSGFSQIKFPPTHICTSIYSYMYGVICTRTVMYSSVHCAVMYITVWAPKFVTGLRNFWSIIWLINPSN